MEPIVKQKLDKGIDKFANGVMSSTKEFTKEFKKAINTAVLGAFGILIALVWKDVITEFVNTISSQSPVKGKVISALVVTLVCVVSMVILTKLLQDRSKHDETQKN